GLEALLAVDGPSLRGLEGDGRLLAALRAGGRGLDPLARRMIHAGVALRLAVLAALGLVLEVLVRVEELLAGGPYEGLVALDAQQTLVSELHGHLPSLEPNRCRAWNWQGLCGPAKPPIPG